MRNSKIEWTDNTFNPWWGCVRISPACDHCYAEQFAKRKTRTKSDLWGRDANRLISRDRYWDEPRRWNRRAERNGTRERVFCGSMCDVMEKRPDLDEPRMRLFEMIEATHSLILSRRKSRSCSQQQVIFARALCWRSCTVVGSESRKWLNSR